jgi:hypothetical protein
VHGLEYLFFTCSLQVMDYGKTLRSHALPPAQEHPRWPSLPSHHQAPRGFEGAMLMSVCRFRSARRRRSRARETLLALQSSGPQKQKVVSFNIAPGYEQTMDARTLVTVNAFFRRDRVNYYPSRNPLDDSPATLCAFRRRRTASRREAEQDSGPVPNSSRSVATLAF